MDQARNYFFMFFVFLLLVGCNSNASNNGDVENDGGSQAKSSSDEVVTLQFWGGVPPEAGPQAVVDEWNEHNPDIQVEYTRFVNDDDGTFV